MKIVFLKNSFIMLTLLPFTNVTKGDNQIIVNDKPFQLSRMNYFLVQLSIADLLTTGLTLFPEIGVENNQRATQRK